MSRYIVKPRADWSDDERPHLEGKVVFEPEPIDTGLLDKRGSSIYRVKDPIGFVRSGDVTRD